MKSMGFLDWAARLDASVGRRLGVNINAAEAISDDDHLLAEWRELHPVEPWRGQDGRGGFVGWANRLDEGVGVRAGVLKPREKSFSIPVKAILRELLRSPVRWYWVAGLPPVIAFDAVTHGRANVSLLFALTVTMVAAGRVRRRRLAEMRQELAGGGDVTDQSDGVAGQ